MTSLSGDNQANIIGALTQRLDKELKISNDQELMQSEPKSRPQNESGKYLKLQCQNTKRTYANRMSSSLPKGGHSATQT